MSAPVLPHLFGPVADLLLADPTFAALVPGGLGPSAPKEIARPYAVLRVFAAPLSGKGTAWHATVALNGCAADWFDSKHPDTVAWNIVAAGADVLNRARNVQWENLSYTAEVTDGPNPMDPDKSRGEAIPLYWAQVRASLRIHAR